MDRFQKVAPWLTRLILLPPAIIFALIAIRYLTNPVASAAAQGIVLPAGLGVTIARVGLGGFPLGCGIFLATCLLSRRRLLTGLTFVATIVSVVLAVRIFGMVVDSTVEANMRLVSREIGLLAVTGIGIFLELSRLAYSRRMHPKPQGVERRFET
jgi:hypothetical protein